LNLTGFNFSDNKYSKFVRGRETIVEEIIFENKNRTQKLAKPEQSPQLLEAVFFFLGEGELCKVFSFERVCPHYRRFFLMVTVWERENYTRYFHLSSRRSTILKDCVLVFTALINNPFLSMMLRFQIMDKVKYFDDSNDNLNASVYNNIGVK